MHRSRRVATAAALAALTAGAVSGSADAQSVAHPPAIKAKIKHRNLYLTGTRDADVITLRVKAAKPDYLAVDLGDDGTTDLKIERRLFDEIIVRSRAGDDVVRIDETAGLTIPFTTTTPTSLRGGGHDDTLLGGSGIEDFRGGAGDDVVDGNQGNDFAWLGKGDDEFIWDPGDGSDTIEGGWGHDLMTFNGSGGNETFESIANGHRLRFTRSLGNIVMDTNDIEQVDLNMLGGSDFAIVNDLSATDVEVQNLDGAAALGGAGGDGVNDTVQVQGTEADDAITVSGVAGGPVSVAGLVPAVSIGNADATDALRIVALGGDDTVDASALEAGTMSLSVLAGIGNDTVRGGRGIDTILAGEGNDVVDGNQGNDTGDLEAGDDEFIWDPGDGSDIVEGREGQDVMTFNGSGGDEIFDASAIGQRLRFFRNLGNIVMDTDDVERVDLNALGGADVFTLNDLTGTDVTAFAADLAGVLGGTTGDGLLDRVIVNGTAGNDAITVAGGSGSVSLDGLFTALDIANAEATDELAVNGLAGTDTLDSAGLAPGTVALTFTD